MKKPSLKHTIRYHPGKTVKYILGVLMRFKNLILWVRWLSGDRWLDHKPCIHLFSEPDTSKDTALFSFIFRCVLWKTKLVILLLKLRFREIYKAIMIERSLIDNFYADFFCVRFCPVQSKLIMAPGCCGIASDIHEEETSV